MKKVYELETARLRLRQWTNDDKTALARLNANARVMEFFPHTLSRAESDALAERIMRALMHRGWGWWAVEVKNQHRFIGFVGISIPSADLPFNPCVEVGWRLDYPYWGNGYATEAARAAISFGFGTLNLEKIVSFTTLLNTRSQAVMKKLGMQRGSETFIHPDVPEGSDLQEHCFYQLSQDSWLSQSHRDSLYVDISILPHSS